MERRVLLAVALSLLILFGFRYYQERGLGESKPARPANVVTPPPAPSAPAASEGQPPATSEGQPPAASVEKAERAPALGETQAVAQQLVIDSGIYRAVLDNRGGLITSWQLSKYKSAKGGPFEMIAEGHGGDTRPYPGSLVLDDAGLTRMANADPYAIQIVEGEGKPGSVLSPPVTISLTLTRGDFSVVKRYSFPGANYVAHYSVTLEKAGKPLPGRILLGEDIGPEHEHLMNPSGQLRAVYDQAGKVSREAAPKDENEIKRIGGNILWVGLDMQYFAIIAVPPRPFDAFELQRRPVKTFGLDGKEISRDLVRLTIPANGDAQFQLYIGPKEQSNLESVPGANLQKVIDYGMFSFLVRPLLVSLKWIDKYVHNYGVAIILLTLLLTLLLFPFRLKQMISMRKMQAVQPKIKAIQEKYKRYKATDPKKAEMNQEIMAIYKAHNVNPLGGCLPLLLQMPLLFAFYSLLGYSIDLRQAPFFGWIHDLSAKDPYYVLPIIMGITMLISQKMTPMTPGTDPTQSKVMMIMPVVFTVMFLNVSSGLNLYFLCSNVFQITFQKIAERWVSDKPAERRSKS
jgi:YidC/Oxa1 family membrane protein insertase